MKTKKKYLKKLSFSNRNISIRNYNNYLIYSYLNNYNLKLFFFFEKFSYNQHNKKLIKNLYNNVINNSILRNSKLFLEKKNQNSYNWKNKFFYKNIKNTLNISINSKLNIKTTEDLTIGLVNKDYIYEIKKFEASIILFKELILFIQILNLLKIYEYYKVLILLRIINTK